MKKILVFVGLLSIPAIADELHVFTNGEVADADKINENFEILQASGGGCSAEQQDSTVVITCADGTSAVLASEGTVITYPQSTVGQSLDYETLPSGDIILVDNDGVVLGTVDRRGNNNSSYIIDVENEFNREWYLALWNDAVNSEVVLTSYSSWTLLYTDSNCESTPYFYNFTGLSTRINITLDVDGELFVTNGNDRVSSPTIFNGRRRVGHISLSDNYTPTSECIPEDQRVEDRFYLLSEFVVPAEIASAAYPVKLEQVP